MTFGAGDPDLRLRPLRATDEAEFRAAHDSLMTSDGFRFGLNDFGVDTDWTAYVELVTSRAQARDVMAGWVPSTFLVAVVGGVIVGRASIRHVLNDWLAREGGHIGYAVLPEHRRRGYATEILRQSLIVARSLGTERVLVICDDTNTGSAAVIEANGGKLEGVVAAEDGHLIRRYWID